LDTVSAYLQPLRSYELELLVACIVVALLLFLIVFAALTRLHGRIHRIGKILSASSGGSLEDLIQQCLSRVGETSDRLGSIESHLESVADNQQLCLQKVGLVRFDAYADVHGKQSFSLALLNARNNGAVITGLFGRTDARCYGKPIVGGKSEHTLSEEEKQAVEVAMHKVEVPRA
jgi:hypothetical protein